MGDATRTGVTRGGWEPGASVARMEGRARRLELGQWYTPPEVADLALALALPAGAARRRARVLDPSCGDGVVLLRARAAGIAPDRLVGVELDPAAAAAARAAVPGAEIVRGDLFAWSAAHPGFDAVVGNPPYVRQERLSAGQKMQLRRRLAEDWPDASAAELAPLVGRADLAAAVAARAVRLCRPGGRIALVVSSALLDAGYGRPLWRLVERAGRVVAIVEAAEERWFPDAAVNAAIVVIERAGGQPREADEQVTVARLRVSTAEAARRVRSRADLASVAAIRRAPAGAPASWAAALRAPEVWFELARRAGDRLVPLAELAEVRRGITSGANDLFYLPRERAAALGLEPAVLAPLLRSPRDAGGGTIEVDPARLDTLALIAPADERALAGYPAARRYVAGRAAAADRPTLRARRPWWALPARPARLFMTKAYAARFVQHLAPAPLVCDQRLYSVHPRPGVAPELLAAALNSTFAALAIESLGRASLGEGALEWTVADAASLPLLDPRRLDRRGAAAVRAALDRLSRRPIGPVDQEVGRADRARLDRAVAAVAPELAALLPEVHRALCESVSRRARRARGSRSAGRPAGRRGSADRLSR